MTTPGHYRTETSDMIAVHRALLGSLDAAPTLVAKAIEDPERTDAVGSFFENVLEFLHVHHAGEDEFDLSPVGRALRGEQGRTGEDR